MNNYTGNLFTESYEQLLVLTDLITLLVPAKATAGQYSICKDIVPPLVGPPPHSHPDEEIFNDQYSSGLTSQYRPLECLPEISLYSRDS